MNTHISCTYFPALAVLVTIDCDPRMVSSTTWLNDWSFIWSELTEKARGEYVLFKNKFALNHPFFSLNTLQTGEQKIVIFIDCADNIPIFCKGCDVWVL